MTGARPLLPGLRSARQFGKDADDRDQKTKEHNLFHVRLLGLRHVTQRVPQFP
jgi:hypothetical protein